MYGCMQTLPSTHQNSQILFYCVHGASVEWELHWTAPKCFQAVSDSLLEKWILTVIPARKQVIMFLFTHGEQEDAVHLIKENSTSSNI